MFLKKICMWLTLSRPEWPYSSFLAKTSILKLEGIIKKILWAPHLWFGRRKESILSYFSNINRNQNSVVKRLILSVNAPYTRVATLFWKHDSRKKNLTESFRQQYCTNLIVKENFIRIDGKWKHFSLKVFSSCFSIMSTDMKTWVFKERSGKRGLLCQYVKNFALDISLTSCKETNVERDNRIFFWMQRIVSCRRHHLRMDRK